MSDVVIRTEGLGKRYQIGSQKAMYSTIRESITDAVGAPFRRKDLSAKDPSEMQDPVIWALRNVSFEVKRGEAVGIIGPNGAGKTTLLKILARITKPTEGVVNIYGRIGSLLEVGTGFHPELTGRENIYLNGAILGMHKNEIERKFDEIVDFSGIETFIDTPVKRYSSGMYVRLAFAVAAHLEPEILVVDEVLSVGDAAFQKKSMGKMGEVAQEGRTVLFVSHHMGAVGSLCSRGILIIDGEVVIDGNTDSVIQRYFEETSTGDSSKYICETEPNSKAWIKEVTLLNSELNETNSFNMTDEIVVDTQFRIIKETPVSLSIQIREYTGSPIFHFPTADDFFSPPQTPGVHHIRTRIPPLYLYPGTYKCVIALSEVRGGQFEKLHVIDTINFEIHQDHQLTSRSLSRQLGVVFKGAKWSNVSS